MKGKTPSTAEERMNWNISPELYAKIRDTWNRHVELELVENDYQRAVDEMISTKGVYEVVQTGQRWEGHEGAMTFYGELVKACPEPAFELVEICVGPQGVFGVANMTGRMEAPFAGFDQVGQDVKWRIINMFQWDPDEEKIFGERIHYFGPWPPQTPEGAVGY